MAADGSAFLRILCDEALFRHVCTFQPGVRGADWRGEAMSRRAAAAGVAQLFDVMGPSRLPVTGAVIEAAASRGHTALMVSLMERNPGVELMSSTLASAARNVRLVTLGARSMNPRGPSAATRPASISPPASLLSQGASETIHMLDGLREQRLVDWQAVRPSLLRRLAQEMQDEGTEPPLPGDDGEHGPAPECGTVSLLEQVRSGRLSAADAAARHAWLRHASALSAAIEARRRWLQVAPLRLDMGVAAAAAEGGHLDVVYWTAHRLREGFVPFPVLCAAVSARHSRLAMFVLRKWRSKFRRCELSRCWALARQTEQLRLADSLMVTLVGLADWHNDPAADSARRAAAALEPLTTRHPPSPAAR